MKMPKVNKVKRVLVKKEMGEEFDVEDTAEDVERGRRGDGLDLRRQRDDFT